MIVNLNEAPLGIENNTVFDVYLIAITTGKAEGWKKFTFKLIQPPHNDAPIFMGELRYVFVEVKEVE